MKIMYNLKERKPFVQALEEITGVKSVYKKPPTFAYAVGDFTVIREGNLEFDDKADAKIMQGLLAELEQRGFIPENNPYLEQQVAPEEMDEESLSEEASETAGTQEIPQNDDLGLTVAMPRTYFKEQTLEKLKSLIASKQTLIKKALGITELPVVEGEDKISFPWFQVKPADKDVVTAYSHFIYALCEMARNQKRINATEKEVENEKYAFRCFLLRLGFIGEQYKNERKILLQNLSGSAAFKNNKDKGDVHEISEQTDGGED